MQYQKSIYKNNTRYGHGLGSRLGAVNKDLKMLDLGKLGDFGGVPPCFVSIFGPCVGDWVLHTP